MGRGSGSVAPANNTSTRTLFPHNLPALPLGVGIRPCRALADVPMSMQVDPHSLLRDLYPCLLAQVQSEQLGGSVRCFLSYLVGIYFNDAQ
jgi:hypothetical protein